jgi:hypothetical protein
MVVRVGREEDQETIRRAFDGAQGEQHRGEANNDADR